MKSCNCWADPVFEFRNWRSFTEVANDGKFRSVPDKEGVYCLRVKDVGETDLNKIKSKFRQPPLTEALEKMSKASMAVSKASKEMSEASMAMFEQCGFKRGFKPGWELKPAAYPDYLEAFNNDLKAFNNDLSEIQKLIRDGKVRCPILYIGRSKWLKRRMWDLMNYKHNLCVPLWALLCSKWTIELAWRCTNDSRKKEKKAKEKYRKVHDEKLPFIMKQ